MRKKRKEEEEEEEEEEESVYKDRLSIRTMLSIRTTM
jgi:hypothetical protein